MMKHMDLPKKTAILISLLLVVILCGAMFFVASGEKGGDIITNPITLKDKLTLEQWKVRDSLVDNFDHVNDAMVQLETSDNEISMAYIFIIASEEISDPEMNNISEYIQNYFDGLPKEQIAITYVDSSYRVLQSVYFEPL